MTTVLTRLTTALADRYTIEREIGEGGMATVYLATDVRHERRVAIKVLHPELSAMLGPERFLSEIKLTASLQHPNILPLFDSGAADGLLYYVMPFVEGETLRRRLDRERQLPVADAVRLATEIADALQYAHERGIVHRDIKPENVLLQSGRAVVADFGIALAVQQAGGTRMTQTGMSLGTPQYMAPEQAMGERNVDARADIYALGVMTYEMLAGEPPFTGPTAQAIVAKVMTERARPLRSLRDTVPDHVESGVATALEKLPADRFSSAAQFAASLDSATATNAVRRSGSGSASHASSGTRASIRTAALAAVMLVIGVVIGAKFINQLRGPVRSDKELPFRFAVTAPDTVRMRLVCCGQMFAISPNGRWLVFQGSPGTMDSTKPLAEHHQLYLRDLTDLNTRALPGTQDAVSLSFSPNSSDFVFVVGRELKRLSLTGTEAQLLATLPEGFNGGASWGSDDTISVGVLGQVLKVSANGGVPTALFDRDTTGAQLTGPQRWARERVVLYSSASDARVPQVTWRSLATGTVKTLMAGSTPVYLELRRALLLVSPDGSLMQYPFNLATGDTTGPGVRVASGVVLRSPILAHAEYAVSATGTLVLASRRSNLLRGGTLVTVGATTTTTKRVMPEFVGFNRPMFSPKSDRLAVLAAPDAGGYSLQLYDVARNVTTRAPIDSAVAAVGWTATGDSLVYQTNPHDFYVRAADGSGAPTPVLSIRDWTSRADGITAWGPYIAFPGTRAGATSNVDIAVAHRDSLGAVRAYTTSAANESDPAISPDGKWLAYTSSESGRVDVWVSAFPVAAGRYLVSTDGGRTPQWASDSRTVFFVWRSSVYATAFTPGPTPVIGTPRLLYARDPWGSAVVSPSGKLMMFSDRAREGITQGLLVTLHAFEAK